MTNANQFFDSSNGSERFFYHRSSKITITSGLKDLIDTCSAYWLFDLIISYQSKRRVKGERFQSWDLKRGGGNRFTITARDGSHRRIVYQFIPHCNFNYDLATLWLVDGTLMLPKEY